MEDVGLRFVVFVLLQEIVNLDENDEVENTGDILFALKSEFEPRGKEHEGNDVVQVTQYQVSSCST